VRLVAIPTVLDFMVTVLRGGAARAVRVRDEAACRADAALCCGILTQPVTLRSSGRGWRETGGLLASPYLSCSVMRVQLADDRPGAGALSWSRGSQRATPPNGLLWHAP
jgi:hypothetical protein